MGHEQAYLITCHAGLRSDWPYLERGEACVPLSSPRPTTPPPVDLRPFSVYSSPSEASSLERVIHITRTVLVARFSRSATRVPLHCRSRPRGHGGLGWPVPGAAFDATAQATSSRRPQSSFLTSRRARPKAVSSAVPASASAPEWFGWVTARGRVKLDGATPPLIRNRASLTEA